jgi:hypothetical protein
MPDGSGAVTSVTTGRNKSFDTPAGSFTYRYLNAFYYSRGIIKKNLGEGRSFFMATPEKALIDKVYLDCTARTLKELREYLLGFLRIGKKELKILNWKELARIADIYKNPHVKLLVLLTGVLL